MSNVIIRPMTEADLPLMTDWLKQPHVAAWFHEHEPNLEEVKTKYLPRIRGESPTKMFVSCMGNKAIGMVQAYNVAEYPEYAKGIGNPKNAVSLDLFIGDPEEIGKGVGTEVLKTMSQQTVPEVFPETELIIATPSINNPVSVQAFVNAGFEKGPVVDIPGEANPEQIVSLRLEPK